jgi:hypothetical protein
MFTANRRKLLRVLRQYQRGRISPSPGGVMSECKMEISEYLLAIDLGHATIPSGWFLGLFGDWATPGSLRHQPFSFLPFKF